jgi:hypothetical protein
MTGSKRAQHAELSILSPELLRFFLEASAKNLYFKTRPSFLLKTILKIKLAVKMGINIGRKK